MRRTGVPCLSSRSRSAMPMASLLSPGPKYLLVVSRHTPQRVPPRVGPAQTEHVPFWFMHISCYIAQEMSSLSSGFDDISPTFCPLCRTEGEISHNNISNGQDKYTAWCCTVCDFCGGDVEAVPMAWALRFHILRLEESWDGFGVPPKMPRDRHAEQVQAKMQAMQLLEGRGGHLRRLPTGAANPGGSMAVLAEGPGAPVQGNLGAAFGSPKAPRRNVRRKRPG